MMLERLAWGSTDSAGIMLERLARGARAVHSTQAAAQIAQGIDDGQADAHGGALQILGIRAGEGQGRRGPGLVCGEEIHKHVEVVRRRVAEDVAGPRAAEGAHEGDGLADLLPAEVALHILQRVRLAEIRAVDAFVDVILVKEAPDCGLSSRDLGGDVPDEGHVARRVDKAEQLCIRGCHRAELEMHARDGGTQQELVTRWRALGRRVRPRDWCRGRCRRALVALDRGLVDARVRALADKAVQQVADLKRGGLVPLEDARAHHRAAVDVHERELAVGRQQIDLGVQPTCNVVQDVADRRLCGQHQRALLVQERLEQSGEAAERIHSNCTGGVLEESLHMRLPRLLDGVLRVEDIRAADACTRLNRPDARLGLDRAAERVLARRQQALPPQRLAEDGLDQRDRVRVVAEAAHAGPRGGRALHGERQGRHAAGERGADDEARGGRAGGHAALGPRVRDAVVLDARQEVEVGEVRVDNAVVAGVDHRGLRLERGYCDRGDREWEGRDGLHMDGGVVEVEFSSALPEKPTEKIFRGGHGGRTNRPPERLDRAAAGVDVIGKEGVALAIGCQGRASNCSRDHLLALVPRVRSRELDHGVHDRIRT
eukprot:m.73279 g.73279  ORF g.73279 m.73279 type:complete len:600 (+) comp7714_c0_seq2:317-2116(+)